MQPDDRHPSLRSVWQSPLNAGTMARLMVASVFVLQHSYELEGCEETKLIGVYSTREAGEAAIERLRTQPGFCDLPDDFQLESYELDRDHWIEGFATVRYPV